MWYIPVTVRLRASLIRKYFLPKVFNGEPAAVCRRVWAVQRLKPKPIPLYAALNIVDEHQISCAHKYFYSSMRGEGSASPFFRT